MVHNFISMLDDIFLSTQFTFEIQNNEQIPLLDVPVKEIVPISWNLMNSEWGI